MKRIGIIGGLSPESTLYYYEKFIQFSRERFPSNFYPVLIIYSLNFKEFAEGDWERRKKILLEAANSLINAGAQVIGIAANTPHRVFPYVEERVKAKMVSIIDAVGNEARRRGMKKVLLLGTKTTMEEEFYRLGLKELGVDAITPEENERREVERIIREELTFHNFRSGTYLKNLIEKYSGMVDGVVLGCTELPLAVKEEDVSIPLLDSAALHIHALIEEAIR